MGSSPFIKYLFIIGVIASFLFSSFIIACIEIEIALEVIFLFTLKVLVSNSFKSKAGNLIEIDFPFSSKSVNFILVNFPFPALL